MITVSLSIIQITHMKNYFVTGTDTGVGKTYFISKFTQQFMNSISINIVKPIESGCELKNGNLVAYEKKFKDTSINGIPQFNSKWQTSNNDELIDVVIENSCSEFINE